MMKSKLKIQMELQSIDYKKAFLSQNSYIEALQNVAFPEQITLIHFSFYICKNSGNLKIFICKIFGIRWSVNI